MDANFPDHRCGCGDSSLAAVDKAEYLRLTIEEALEAINEDAGGLDFPPLVRGCDILQNALKEK